MREIIEFIAVGCGMTILLCITGVIVTLLVGIVREVWKEWNT